METLKKPIALGRTAEIYAWKEGYILKLFWDWAPSTWVEHEARVARAVHATGILPVPAVSDIIEINNRLGLEYERVEGVSMLQTSQRNPWMFFRLARLLAELHAKVHSCILQNLPSQRQRLTDKIQTAELPSETRKKVLNTLDRLPDGDKLCHGDFHPDNVLMTAQGPVIIDWIDVTSGNPFADVARTSLLMSIGEPPKISVFQRRILNFGRHWIRSGYLKRYFQLRPDNETQLAAWQPVIAAARLSEDIPEERERLLTLIKSGLAQ